ncbi:MAG TPA: DUF1573 domain-containing protein [Vicinamibacteria bacterium]
MKKAFVLMAVMVAAGAPFGVADDVKAEGAKPAVAGPHIAVEPPSFDFGKAVQSKTLQKEFSIRNLGDADLVLDSVTTSCGCTVAEGYSKVVKPGASTRLLVSLQTRTTSGKLQKSVLIKSNDPAKGLYELKLEATVAPPETK